jgi:hypothetical protein
VASPLHDEATIRCQSQENVSMYSSTGPRPVAQFDHVTEALQSSTVTMFAPRTMNGAGK